VTDAAPDARAALPATHLRRETDEGDKLAVLCGRGEFRAVAERDQQARSTWDDPGDTVTVANQLVDWSAS